MLNIALFISGRVLYYKECLLPLVNNIKKKYNILLFFSINTFSESDTSMKNINNIIQDLYANFGENIAEIKFEKYKMPKSYVENHLKNNIDLFYYNSLSCYYNDRENFNLIEKYEKNNNMVFDIICKVRSDIYFFNNNIDFIQDDPNDLIIRNKHMQNIRYWGHIYKDTPLLVSDAFAYGNKKSMKIYCCSTYDWILKTDLLSNGDYFQGPEVYLTDSLLQHKFYNILGGENEPTLSREEVISKFNNNPYGINIIYLNNVFYNIVPIELRQRNNFVINKNNVLQYTET